MPHMSGICIIVTGRSGAGKTALISECITDSLLNLEYATSYVTRTRREGDYGYTYVNKEEYAKRRTQSKIWDHFEFFSEYYGTDVEELIEKVKSGRNIIMTTYPSLSELHKIKSMYTIPLATIFIDIPRELSLERMKRERQDHEMERLDEDDKAITLETITAFDYTFIPKGNYEEDVEQFRELLKEIVSK
jgi:guanylate kinase